MVFLVVFSFLVLSFDEQFLSFVWNYQVFFFLIYAFYALKKSSTLAGVAQWVEHWTVDRNSYPKIMKIFPVLFSKSTITLSFSFMSMA